jgi:ribonuclease HI
MELFFDGGADPNPGLAGAGALLVAGGKTAWEGSVFVGERATNNEAEYRGLILGLERAVAEGLQSLTVKGDSELVIKQMLGTYRCKAPNLQPLHQRARALALSIPSCRFEHIRRELNAKADALATAGIALGAAPGGKAQAPAGGSMASGPPATSRPDPSCASHKRQAESAGLTATGPSKSARPVSGAAHPAADRPHALAAAHPPVATDDAFAGAGDHRVRRPHEAPSERDCGWPPALRSWI